jgi:aspartate aminotransferase
VIRAAIDIQSHTTSGPNTFAQYGGIAALEESQESIEMMRATFERRRNLMYMGVSAIPGLVCPKPHGAFYLFPNISATGLDSITFCDRLLEQEYLALVPGVAFGMDTNVRLSYAADIETIEKGIERLARFMRTL